MINSGGILDDPAQPTFSFQYGYIEASIRIPGGKGLWPAFWMQPESTVATGVDHSADGEIDIMDNGTGNPLVLHGGVIVNGVTFAQQMPGRLSPGFHTFGVDWEPDHITWYVDGKEWMTTTDTTLIPHTPMYPIVDLAVSSGTVWGSAPVSGTPFPATMSVDYIRVWTQK
jgi:beta-glucanase (GH16 family)